MKKLILGLALISSVTVAFSHTNRAERRGEGRILFYSNRDGNAEIYVMKVDGSQLQRLTHNNANDRCPTGSPDGTKIAFTSDRTDPNPSSCSPSCNTEIFVMNIDGSDQRQLTDTPAATTHPAWSPDGTRIAFTSMLDGSYEIFVMNADGSHLQRITENDHDDMFPVWSPEGDKIVFNEKINDNFGISIMNADGTNRKSRLDTAAWELFPRWSPDGSKIALFANIDVPMKERNVYVMNADGTNITQLTNAKAVDEDPAWSPDGMQIVFQSNRDNNYEIYVMNVDGTNQRRLTNHSAGEYWPSWLPFE